MKATSHSLTVVTEPLRAPSGAARCAVSQSRWDQAEGWDSTTHLDRTQPHDQPHELPLTGADLR